LEWLYCYIKIASPLDKGEIFVWKHQNVLIAKGGKRVGEIIDKFTDFACKIQFNDLPEYVVNEMKRVVLDSIGCAIAGHSTERGKIAADLARKLSGRRESTIIGTNDKVSCANAAFANGELMNALDFDAISSVGRHDVPTLVSTTLALAESVGSSGEDLILATALAFEISLRIRSAVKGIHDPGPEKDKMLWPEVAGYSFASLGAAVGAGKFLNLDQEHMGNAIGIAGYICPPSLGRKFHYTSPIRMSKYGSLGWGAQAGVTAALLAEMGFRGDTDLFDGEYGFWRYIGKGKGEWNMEGVAEGLGQKWRCHKIQYKQYPCGL
jgi:2-methylcitrate dehydratase PrpD